MLRRAVRSVTVLTDFLALLPDFAPLSDFLATIEVPEHTLRRSHSSLMNSQTTKKVTLALGVASVAASVGNVAVKAGPALQTLNNLTNTAEFSINNTYGQSFSVDGVISSAVAPFAVATQLSEFNAAGATLTTGFTGVGMVGSLAPVSAVVASAIIAAATGVQMILNADELTGITITGGTAVATVGASVSSTFFGPSTVKATSSFTNQLINDLSAF